MAIKFNQTELFNIAFESLSKDADAADWNPENPAARLLSKIATHLKLQEFVGEENFDDLSNMIAKSGPARIDMMTSGSGANEFYFDRAEKLMNAILGEREAEVLDIIKNPSGQAEFNPTPNMPIDPPGPPTLALPDAFSVATGSEFVDINLPYKIPVRGVEESGFQTLPNIISYGAPNQSGVDIQLPHIISGNWSGFNNGVLGQIPSTVIGEEPGALNVSPNTQPKDYTEITVEPGDNMWNLVKDHYGLENGKDIQGAIEKIAQLNGIKDVGQIDKGDKIKFPDSPCPDENAPKIDWKKQDDTTRANGGRIESTPNGVKPEVDCEPSTQRLRTSFSM